MPQELFYFIVHSNGVIVRQENGASFESSGPVMFVHTHVDTLVELKKLILSHLGSADSQEIGHLAYRFQAITTDNRLEYRPSWISEDSHVWMTFEVHKSVMDGKVMKFFAEVRHVGSSSKFRLPGPSTDPALSHVLALEDVAMRDYNSGEDLDYEEESSCHSTEEDEEVPNTSAGCGRLVLPAPLPIPDLAQGGAKDRFAAHLYGTRHGGRSLSARQHIDDECRDAPDED
ncbi:hypothetical protein PIB30_042830 [Stylosanthes scabra]|uniref:Uncharacterized protein n=1 Tax=Stylosanthes scabra TaxID=79078 RepID=A0ABU6VI77_9FABA|nr:hypothetical protein [Stylosanthes scabra]